MLDAHIVKQRREFLVDVSLTLSPGQSLALFGTSGAGKSTVLACIAGLQTPDSGHVRWAGATFFPPAMPLHHRGVGMLTQNPELFPHLRVRENVEFGVNRRVADAPGHAQWIETLRDRLHLAPLWNAPATRISGGQARRVSLARMLAPRPRLVLLDEPFTGLDRQTTRELVEDLLLWQKELGFALLAVDHQVEVLERLCPQQALVVEQGRAVQQGSWRALRSCPATPLLASLLAPL